MFDDDVGFDKRYFKGCKKCGGRGFFTNDSNVATPCECWRLDTLISRIKKAGVPEDYFDIDLNNLENDVTGWVIEYKEDVKDSDGNIVRHAINVHQFFKDFLVSLHNIRNTGKSLLLLGGNGVGKTMLSCIVLKNALWYSVVSKKEHSDYSGYFITFREYIDYIFKKDEESVELLEYIRNVDFLVLDEVGSEPVKKDGPTDFFRSVLDDLLRYRSNNKLVTIMTSNMSEKEFKNHYKQSEFKSFNRIWSIIEGKYYIISLIKKGGDFRKQKRKDNLKVVVDKYKK